MATSGGLLASCGVPPLAAPHATCSPAFISFFTGKLKAVRSLSQAAPLTPSPFQEGNHVRAGCSAHLRWLVSISLTIQVHASCSTRDRFRFVRTFEATADFTAKPASHFRTILRHQSQKQVNAGDRVVTPLDFVPKVSPLRLRLPTPLSPSTLCFAAPRIFRRFSPPRIGRRG